MKVRRCHAILLLFVFPVICLAQQPSPALADWVTASDVSASYVLPVKNLGLSDFGVGGELSASHYFTNHLGIQSEVDYLSTDYLNFRNRGARAGAIFRFRAGTGMQPYVRALVGYSWVQDSSLRPTNVYHGSPSVLGGGGVDFRVLGPFCGRAGVDVQYDWSTGARVGRGILGISYRFHRLSGM
jgi:hypothetical protein